MLLLGDRATIIRDRSLSRGTRAAVATRGDVALVATTMSNVYMANRRTAAAAAPVDQVDTNANGASPPLVDADEASEADAILADAHSENPRPPKSAIYRVDRETGTQQWLAEVATNLVSLEYVARKFGGGKYTIRHRKVKAGGGYQYAGNDTYEIDPSVKPESPAAPASSGAAAGLAVPPGGNIADTILNAGVLQMLQQMNAQNQLTLAMVERMRKTDESPRASVPDMITAGAALVTALAPLFKDRKDPAELALKLAEAMRPAVAPAPASTDVLSAFEKGMAVVSRIRGQGASSSDSIMPVIAEGIKTLGTVVSGIANERGRAANGGAPIDPRPRPPLALVPSSSTPESPPMIPPMNGAAATPASARVWFTAAAPLLPSLLSFARFMGPDAAAATISRNLSDEEFYDLVDDIRDASPPGFGGRLVQQFPAAASIDPAWFNDLIQLLLQEADAPEESAGDEAEATGEPPAAS